MDIARDIFGFQQEHENEAQSTRYGQAMRGGTLESSGRMNI